MADDSVAPTIWHWLAAALDELDYGIVVLFDGMRVVHVNDAALAELDDLHPLQLVGGELRARLARDVAPLHEAVTAAATAACAGSSPSARTAQRGSVSVVPLEAADAGPRAVLVVLGKREMCESLSVQGFARSHGLTGAETAGPDGPLRRHAAGADRAQLLGVAVSTVRSQIGSMRAEDRRREHPRAGAPGRGAAAGQGRAAPSRRRPADAAVPAATDLGVAGIRPRTGSSALRPRSGRAARSGSGRVGGSVGRNQCRIGRQAAFADALFSIWNRFHR